MIEDNWDDQNTFITGAGNDTVYARRATDTFDAGEGVDTLSYGPFESPSRVYFPVRIDVPNGKATSLESGVQMEATFSNFERFVGSDKNDLIIGWIFPDHMQGLGGNDEIHGGALGDTILGGAGDDQLWGEGGDDRLEGADGLDGLHGGPGADMMIGGTGKDSFSGDEPDPPDEETDTAADWDNALMESCSSAIGCP